MDSQSLTNVLAILRLLGAGNNNISTADMVRQWAGNDPSEEAVLKVASYVLEQVEMARSVIEASGLVAEAKTGVMETLNQLRGAFSIVGIHTAFGSFMKNIPSSISNLVILLSAAGLPASISVPEEASSLIAEIADVMALFDDPAIDPPVRDVAKRHLQILSTLLQHIPIFGLEPALTTYFELMMKVRRADTGSSDDAHKQTAGLWDRMKEWGGRIDTIDKIVNSGARLLSHGDKITGLLKYLPS